MTSHSRVSTHPTSHGMGITTRKVLVERVEGAVAVCKDTSGTKVNVRTDIQRAKGAGLPEVGETWLITNDLGMWTFAAIMGYGGGRRQIIDWTSGPLAPNAVQQSMIGLPPAYRLYIIQTDRPARVRLYDFVGHQAADVARPSSTPPPFGSGVVFDLATISGLLEVPILPIVEGADLTFTDDPPADRAGIPITVTNLDVVTTSVTVSFLYVRTE